MVKIFLLRVTTHKIQISTNDANFIDFWNLYNLLHFHYMPQLNTSLIKRKVHTTTTKFVVATQLFITSLLLLGTFSGKIPCFITTETYYFWHISGFPCDYIASWGPHLPFWAIIVVVPWLLAPITGDMTQVLLCRNWVVPGIQSIPLPGLFHGNQGFYFLWVILYFLYREFY